MSLKQLIQAREHLTDAQLIAFLRAAAKVGDRPTSVIGICGGLDQGHKLEEALGAYEKTPLPPRYRMAYNLSVEPGAVDQYRIAFGCKGKRIGDSGVWLVTFAPDASIASIVQEDYWWVKQEAAEQ